ncbi:hypothetical protein K7432_018130 [Basidiobolus ranarum]|uniref:Uncharacterized protein n=1 Tax=Basidiobolus ranarum TaxID=34480 RepID=A0ABR2VJE4_9FUNG
MNEHSSGSQFVFVSYPDRKGSMSSTPSSNDMKNVAIPPMSSSSTRFNSLGSESGVDGKDLPTKKSEPISRRTSKKSPKSHLTFRSYIPSDEGVMARVSAKQKPRKGGQKR